MVRSSFTNLNGLWQFKAVDAGTSTSGAFGKPLNDTILVPFPVESCLSGLRDVNDTNGVPPTYQHMWYRTTVPSDQFQSAVTAAGRTLLHFGAVDWQTDVYVNGLWVGSNTGGYNSFSFDITKALSSGGGEEIFVVVYDPSNMGPQPFGKQRISARYSPGGDTYTPNSGIWQTVWLESVPETYIEGLKINADTKQLTVTVNTNVPDGSPVTVKVTDSSSASASDVVASSAGCKANLPCTVPVPSPKLWSPESPFLYNMTVTLPSGDSVKSYFGMREVKLGKDAGGTTRPMINGKFRVLAGFLDQSWWPDGQYLAPGDEALASDVVVLKTWGMNMIRLHQKVCPTLVAPRTAASYTAPRPLSTFDSVDLSSPAGESAALVLCCRQSWHRDPAGYGAALRR
jgi:beta-galactosidase/beta-glucuronidase